MIGDRRRRNPHRFIAGKVDEQTEQTILNALRVGMSEKSASLLAGVPWRTMLSWMRESDSFRRRCDHARMAPVFMASLRLVQAIQRDDLKAIMFFLSRRTEEFREHTTLEIETTEEKAVALHEAFQALRNRIPAPPQLGHDDSDDDDEGDQEDDDA